MAPADAYKLDWTDSTVAVADWALPLTLSAAPSPASISASPATLEAHARGDSARAAQDGARGLLQRPRRALSEAPVFLPPRGGG
ncbi:MAG: hypothetical protein WDN31_00865 [Hyphomicrobium sp.]